jgi:hypothetical protein
VKNYPLHSKEILSKEFSDEKYSVPTWWTSYSEFKNSGSQRESIEERYCETLSFEPLGAVVMFFNLSFAFV